MSAQAWLEMPNNSCNGGEHDLQLWSRFEEMEELYTDLYCTGQGGLIPLRIFSGDCEA